MDKLRMQTSNIVDENVEFIESRFPNCIVEARDDEGNLTKMVDFDMLKQELSKVVVDGDKERYQMTWPDKRKAILTANAPISATLRPCREDSVDFDNTKNLYIEGDNLDVLKLLRETYLGKVKMIYIDPPYNTGNDFVYNDDFAESADEYIANSGQYDEQGNRLVQNAESNGRFHTDWLNMLYPRIKVAKDLLSDDGVIFISIDENEIVNAEKICDEVFGRHNLVGIIANTNNPKGRSDDKYVATAHEYILIYSKQINSISWYGFSPTEEITKRYNKIDSTGKLYREIDLRKTGENDLREDRPNLFYYFYYNQETGDFYADRSDIGPTNYIQIKPQREDGKEGNWRWGIETAQKQICDLIPKFMPARKVWGIMQKDYLEGRSLVKPTSSWTYKDVNSERGTEEFIALGFDKRVFPKPKPVGTIKRCLTLSTRNNDVVLDFFSGSATTADAVMRLNLEDGGNRRFIMVQLPEICDKDSDAFKSGFNNICDIGKERIRRAGENIKELNELRKHTKDLSDPKDIIDLLDVPFPEVVSEMAKASEIDTRVENLDVGFRVFKLDSSNMKDTYYKPSDYDMSLLDSLDENIKPDRTPEDLLFQVMLDLGLMLDSKIESKIVNGKNVFIVGEYNEKVAPDLICCFDSDVSGDTVTAIAKMKPRYAVFRDSSMSSDSVAVNFDQLFETYSPSTIRKVL